MSLYDTPLEHIKEISDEEMEEKFGPFPGLPKWPQHLVCGRDISVDQAKEVILCTDSFFLQGYGGNNRAWEAWAKETLGINGFPTEKLREEYWKVYHEVKKVLGEEKCKEVPNYPWSLGQECEEKYVLGAKAVYGLGYVYNSWVSSSYIGGPHGFANPSGKIYSSDNIGKWPSCQEVVRDWVRIAHRFPFLELVAILFDKEYSEEGRSPVYALQVKDGEVTRIKDLQQALSLYEEYKNSSGHPTTSLDPMASFLLRLNSGSDGWRSGEQGVPDQWIEEWGKLLRPMIEKQYIESERKAQEYLKQLKKKGNELLYPTTKE